MRTSIVAIAMGMGLLLAACGNPTVNGNPDGGVMSMHGTGDQGVYTAAQTHCQKHGRNARITQILPGGSATFECVKA